jgi:hypothetical protein
LERNLGEASELARMQAFPILGLQLFKRPQPDLEMVADTLAIEFASHTGELDFAMGGYGAVQLSPGNATINDLKRLRGKLNL